VRNALDREGRRIARAIGKRLVLFRNSRPERADFNELVYPKKYPGLIFISVESKDPALAIMGHELGHRFKYEYPNTDSALKKNHLTAKSRPE
jgi:Zn-dependent peptidase ImmA (M78 family)